VTLTVTDSDQGFAERLLAADRETMLAMLAAATPDEAIAAVRALGLRELYELPREIVESWLPDAKTPGSARYIRAQRLTTEPWATAEDIKDRIKQMWRVPDIARAANVRADSASRWRNPDRPGGNIVEEDFDPGGQPRWDPSRALASLKQGRKITDDLYPHNRKRGGGIPPGRPPRPRQPKP
jgi:hypothetical protein